MKKNNLTKINLCILALALLILVVFYSTNIDGDVAQASTIKTIDEANRINGSVATNRPLVWLYADDSSD